MLTRWNIKATARRPDGEGLWRGLHKGSQNSIRQLWRFLFNARPRRVIPSGSCRWEYPFRIFPRLKKFRNGDLAAEHWGPDRNVSLILRVFHDYHCQLLSPAFAHIGLLCLLVWIWPCFFLIVLQEIPPRGRFLQICGTGRITQGLVGKDVRASMSEATRAKATS